MKNTITIFHADSLSGPLKECKQAFEAVKQSANIDLVSGRSKELAEQIMLGRNCDIAAFSDPDVIRYDLIEKGMASWYIVFSTNELVMITQKGNELGISGIADLIRPEVRVVRVTGQKDLATYRTLECVNRAGEAADLTNLVEKIVERTAVSAGTIPEAMQAVIAGRADAGIVYLSAAKANASKLEVLPLPETINLSDQIQNALTIPHSSCNQRLAMEFIQFLQTETGQQILRKAGQPPQIPWITGGEIPKGIVSK